MAIKPKSRLYGLKRKPSQLPEDGVLLGVGCCEGFTVGAFLAEVGFMVDSIEFIGAIYV